MLLLRTHNNIVLLTNRVKKDKLQTVHTFSFTIIGTKIDKEVKFKY